LRFLILIALLIGNFCYAKIPEKEILDIFNERLNSLANPKSFHEFVDLHQNLFPDPLKVNPSMEVEREELKLNDETFTLAIGYRQVATKSGTKDKAAFLKSLWATPELFQKVYNLDGESKVPDTDDIKDSKNRFKARVFKKVPGIEDQDYILDYTITHQYPYTFIRAKLDKDQKGFALRDNLKVLEETKDGLIIREISYLYPLRWYVRALGPTARKTMKTELNKISLIEKCLVEESVSFPPTDEIIKSCIKP
jgi:hypothetical protein